VVDVGPPMPGSSWTMSPSTTSGHCGSPAGLATGSRRFDEAIRVADDCLAMAPDFWRCRKDRVAALVEFGRIAQAREEAGRLRDRR